MIPRTLRRSDADPAGRPSSRTPGAAASAPDSEADDETRGALVKSLVAILLNVGVLTALVVYFGWARAETMANILGIDEAILDMTVDEYARRAVQSVIILPIIAGIAGLAWVAFDQWWRRRLDVHGPDDAKVRFWARWMWLVAVATAVLGVVSAWAAANVPEIAAQAFIAFPLLWGAALLLLLYGVHLRGMSPDAVQMAPMTTGILRGSTAVLVAVGLFWSAANYATVEGTNLAYAFEPRDLPGVEVDSTEPLDLVAPGVVAGCLVDGDATRYRYRGLRLLESTGGRYFLISDDWTREYGVVIVLPISSETTRFTFVRDVDQQRPDGGFTACDDAPQATQATLTVPATPEPAP
ncbi:hypothetical protein ACDF64_05480 [Agromyces sp. MMS24-JH15]|uniref:hypothetical protein n=1 Tax=Agromyces sp. MMS24-JH15 TaxID=3243765 RepID=UPI00374909F2